MQDIINSFLELPVGVRFAIELGVFMILYWIFGRLIFKLLSVIPWALQRLVYVIYFLFDIPASALHHKYGGVFASIDQGLATISGKIYEFMDKCQKALNKPKSIYGGRVFVAYIVVAAYLIIPSMIDFNEGIFTFWHEGYLGHESKWIEWLTSRF